MQDLSKYISPTYQFRNMGGKTRNIFLTVEKSRSDFNVIANTSDIDGGNANRSGWSGLRPLDDTPLDECWENCLTTFKEFYGNK